MMKPISKTRPLVFIIFFLLLTNIGLIFFFLSDNEPSHGRGDRDGKGQLFTALQNDVGFSTAQLNKYQDLRKAQFEKLRPLFNEVGKAKEDFYSLLIADNVPDSLAEEKVQLIGEKQNLVDMQMFNYFKQVRALCEPGQIPQFDSALKKSVLRRMMGGSPGRSKKPR